MTVPADPTLHGTTRAYHRGCRCDACRAAETQRQREWRQRLRDGQVRHRPQHTGCVPVRIRGVDYPSISIAAATLGVTPASISTQLRKFGNADGAGLGGHAPRRHVLNNVKPVRLHGRDFPSVAAAARYLGVSPTHLYRSISRGISSSYAQFLLGKLMAADARAAAARAA